ncbi:MAG: PEGA domain-containing protein [Bradymonadaceae bacterium]|nr:PEGA domain-containing protein [Lujinxingiaceae bacterium]
MTSFSKIGWFFLGLLLIISAPRTSSAQESLNVAVLNMEGVDIAPTLLATLTSVLRNEAQQHEKYDVVNQAPINLSEIVVVLGCNPDAISCLRQAAEHINARVLVYGTVAKRAGGFRVTVEIFDAANGRIIHSLGRNLEETQDPVIAFRREIEAFFSTQKALPATRLQIGSTVHGAEIKIEDVVVGTAPFERAGLPAGQYKVEVSAPNHNKWTAVVELPEGGDVRLWAPLTRQLEKAAQPAHQASKSENNPDAQPLVRSQPPPADEVSSAINWGAWSAISVGGLALIGSGVMGWQMIGVEQQIQDESTSGQLTDRRFQELVDRGESYQWAHRVLLGVGVLGVASGVLWLLLESNADSLASSEGLDLDFSPSSISATWRW